MQLMARPKCLLFAELVRVSRELTYRNIFEFNLCFVIAIKIRTFLKFFRITGQGFREIAFKKFKPCNKN